MSEYSGDFPLYFRRALSLELLERARAGRYTLGRLAEAAQMPLSSLNNVLNGHSANPGILTVLNICQGLDLPLPEVINAAYRRAEAEAAAADGGEQA